MLDIGARARKYPGMYVGATDANGVEVLARIPINNAIDAYLAGEGGRIGVELLADHAIRVTSDAYILPRPFPSDVPAMLRDVFMQPPHVEVEPGDTILIDRPSDVCEPGFADQGDDYRVSDFRSDWEWCLVNALSRSVTVEVHMRGRGWRQEFRDQQPTDATLIAGTAMDMATTVTFYPDETIFDAPPRRETLSAYLRQSSYPVPGLALRLVDARLSPVWMQDFPPTTGVAAYLSEVTHGHHPLTQPIIVDSEGGQTKMLLPLAVWAIMGPASGHDVALDRRAAVRAWRACLAKHAQLLLVAAQAAPGRAIVAERGAAATDGAPQNVDDSLVERRDLPG